MQNMIFKRKLPIPKEIKEQYPLTAELAQVKARRDKEIADVFTGKSGKMVLIIGPCSADREDAVLEYCERLAKLQEAVSDKLVLIPRVYTNKPRTTGDGYKGLLHQPDPRKTSDMLEGVIAIRRLHTNVLANTGLPTADEMLYPDNYRYLSDLLSYVAVGARSVENQEHRLTSSGIDIPVGMKNPTSGDISVMLNSIMAAQHPHTFIYRGWEVDTTGNPLAHAILRGYVNKHGESMPNYHFEELERLYNAYTAKGLTEHGADRGRQPRQFRQKVSGAAPHLQGSAPLLPPQRRNQVHGQGLHGGILLWSPAARRSATAFTASPSPTPVSAGRKQFAWFRILRI